MSKKKLAKLGQTVTYRAAGVESAAIVTAVGDETVNLIVFWDGDSPQPMIGVAASKDDGDGFVTE